MDLISHSLETIGMPFAKAINNLTVLNSTESSIISIL